ncbi:uncharacterized protein F5Z01DRAFT_642610 [Emericellopsis atlantica]|uniref:Uncharacterized protein n=1 Tax=Emericellopsis atlantica TaxID=2614577 RepID=A0A9P8CTX0_9HYPO|nr:uncharacterized protein F5Z01DRAFT_642610 [Emericellopsis atlantica]KAG9259213.1 hypothetical protein F5Z01DRAFT_642610 [Emericellopsis atlantica]
MPTIQPQTTPAPQSPLVAMSPAVAPPSEEQSHFKLPKLRLEVRDLSHKGSSIFLSTTNAVDALQKACQSVLKLLYLSPHESTTNAPPTRSVTLILRDMPGVAYTTGTELDNDHKEIHLSLRYVTSISPETRQAKEIEGVITHELVHCFQHNGHGTCPGGLIEGVADWVRLRCDLSPPHWKKDGSGKWDAGYQHTGYFLEYLEQRFGQGTVRRLNEKLRLRRYEEKAFWTELVGRPVVDLWEDYGKTLENGKHSETSSQ